MYKFKSQLLHYCRKVSERVNRCTNVTPRPVENDPSSGN